MQVGRTHENRIGFFGFGHKLVTVAKVTWPSFVMSSMVLILRMEVSLWGTPRVAAMVIQLKWARVVAGYKDRGDGACSASNSCM